MSAFAEAEPIVTVVAHEDMDDETLRRHINARHMPMAGMNSIPMEWKDWMEPFNLWRQWHARLHAMAVPYGVVNGHEHELKETPYAD